MCTKVLGQLKACVAVNSITKLVPQSTFALVIRKLEEVEARG